MAICSVGFWGSDLSPLLKENDASVSGRLEWLNLLLEADKHAQLVITS
jgi:hypothetical protein